MPGYVPVGKGEKLVVFNTFSYLKTVERSENACDIAGSGSLNSSSSKRVLMEPIDLNVWKFVIKRLL